MNILTHHLRSPIVFENTVKSISNNLGLYLLESLIQNTVQSTLNECADEFFNPIITKTLFNWFVLKWKEPLEKIIKLELHYSKITREIVESDLLKAEKLFEEKIRKIKRKKILFEKYPILSERLVKDSKKYQIFLLEILRNFKKDYKEICDLLGIPFFDKKTPLIISISLLGDSHAGGKQVSLVNFKEKEKSYSIIYKPRSADIDMVMQEVYKWVNSYLEYPLFITKTINKENYHWVEYVSHSPAEKEEDIKEFFMRFGYLTAISYILNGHDLHYENLIASKNQPIILDYECFFAPIIESKDKISLDYRNVASSMLIDCFDSKKDYSGLFGLTDFSGEQDDFKKMESTKNRLIYKNNKIDPLKYTNELKKGFSDAYHIFLKHRYFLTKNIASPLAKIKNIKIRLVFRPTEIYAFLLEKSTYPTLLSDETEYLNHLNWVNKNKFNNLGLEYSEIKQLLNGDIPIFYCRVHENKIFDPDGYAFECKVNSTGYQNIIQNIQEILSEKDLQQQLLIIDNAFEVTRLNIKQKSNFSSIENQAKFPQEFHKKVIEILDNLFVEMITRDKNYTTYWPSYDVDNDNLFFNARTGDSLYDGLSGISLSFLYGAKLFNEEKYLDVIKRSLNYFKVISENYQDCGINTLGVFDGISGIIYFLFHADKQFPNLGSKATLKIYINILIKTLDITIEENVINLDIISGLTGCLVIWQLIKEHVPLEKYEYLLQKIVAILLRKTSNINLSGSFNEGQTLLGFSHGAAGLAWAFQRIHLDYPIQIIQSRIAEALKYERLYFNIAQGNWPVLQKIGAHNETMPLGGRRMQSSWCHGAVGIGLARIDMFRKGYRDEIIPYEISLVGKFLQEKNLPKSINFCHGLLGNIELALQMKEANFLHEANYQHLVEYLLSRIIENNQISCDQSSALANPGLMVGKAGVAYQLMRIIDQRIVPSVLLLN